MATANPKNKNSIFRSKTIQKYTQNRERSVLPRVVAPPVFAIFWLILTLLLVAGAVIWIGKVPIYITEQGTVLGQSASASQDSEAIAVIPMPISAASQLRIGLPVQVRIGQTGPLLHCTISSIDRTTVNPDEIQQKYGIKVTDPSFLLAVKLGATISEHTYAGSLVQVQIQTGSQSVLALFPVFDSLLKDN